MVETEDMFKIPKQNSWEYGKAGNRFKLYFDDVQDLENQIEALKSLGFEIVIREVI